MPDSACRPITHEDLFRFRLVSDPQLSPGGERVAFVVQRSDREKNKYFTSLWLADTDGSSCRAFTQGDHGDRSPRWSPDGQWLAFLSDRDEKSQIWRIPLAGGEAEPLTKLEEGSLGELHWSPDGTRIAFTFRPKPEWQRKSAKEEREKNHRSTPPLVVKRLAYRAEGQGYFGDERWHVYVLDVASGALTQVTHGESDQGSLAWSPDGTRLAFVTNRSPDPDATPQCDEIRIVPAAGGPEEIVAAPPGPKGDLAWSPAGAALAYYGHTDERDSWSPTDPHLWLVPLEGGEPWDLSGSLDRPVGDATLGDLQSFGGGWTGPVWTPDGREILFLVTSEGASLVYSVPVGGGGPICLTPGLRAEVGALSLDREGRRMAAVLGDPSRPSDVVVAERGAVLEFRRLSDLNAEVLGELEIAEPEEVWAPGEAGEVHGWLIRPVGAEDPVPLVLYIHGGPHTQYGWSFMHEIQCLAARGLAVLLTNPRGSRGYGQAKIAAIRGDWGGPDYRDLMAAVDHVVTLPGIAPDRLGVTGGSYGGYMTNWIIGHTDRFRCAVTQRSVVNLHSMGGTCDFNFGSSDYFGGVVWERPERFLEQSPLLYAAGVRTPLLIIHSEGDLRCPIEQAEQLFAALKRQGKEVEFVRYPREANHGLSRSGPPDLRLDRLQRIAGWMEERLR